MKKTDILAVNPGSTSTKVGVYRCEEGGVLTELFVENISHSPNRMQEFESLGAQLPYRKEMIERVLQEKEYDMEQLRAVVGRGGMLAGLKSGGYQMSPEFIRDMMSLQNTQHASNLGAPLAWELA